MSFDTSGKQVTVNYWNEAVKKLGISDTSEGGLNEARMFIENGYFVLKVWDGSSWVTTGVPSEAKPDRLYFSEDIDQNDGIEIDFLASAVVTQVLLHVRGRNFSQRHYTEFPSRTIDAYTQDAGAVAGHSISQTITSSAPNQAHHHTEHNAADSVVVNSGDDTPDHDHDIDLDVTTSSHPDHDHRLIKTLPGSTQKTTFDPSLLKLYISASPGSWGTAKTIDFSSLFSTGGTGVIDITSFVTSGVMNFIRFALNTASAVGGKLNIYIEMK